MYKLRVFTAFSGFDSQCLALNRLKENYPGFDYELVGWSEIDKYAIKAHDALFPGAKNFGDITKIDWEEVPDFDLFTYSSPCQDFSNAGKQKGGEKGSGTRSSLLWECERAIRAKKPKFLLMENVSALVSVKFIDLFNQWQFTLEEIGYRNYAKVLNAKDYGVPQNRDRIFVVSVRDDLDLKYAFPQPFPLDKCILDIKEDKVDEKFFLSEKTIARLEKNMKGNDICVDPNGVAKTICASMDKLTTFDNYLRCVKEGSSYRIRQLTGRECFRLMGVLDKDVDTIQSTGISKTQQYKMAGNSIVVDVLYNIFRKLLVETNADPGTQLELF